MMIYYHHLYIKVFIFILQYIFTSYSSFSSLGFGLVGGLGWRQEGGKKMKSLEDQFSHILSSKNGQKNVTHNGPGPGTKMNTES